MLSIINIALLEEGWLPDPLTPIEGASHLSMKALLWPDCVIISMLELILDTFENDHGHRGTQTYLSELKLWKPTPIK